MTRAALDKRQHIMQAAEKLFTSRQFHEVTTDDVAAAANVGKGTIYRYFQDKDDLLFQITTSGFDELCELLRHGSKVPEKAPFLEQLLGACQQVRTFFSRRRQLLRMMEETNGRIPWCEGGLRQRWTERRKKLAEVLGVIVAKGVDQGVIRRDVPPNVLSSFLLGLLRTQARDLDGTSDQMRQVNVVVELFLYGAEAPGRDLSQGAQSPAISIGDPKTPGKSPGRQNSERAT